MVQTHPTARWTAPLFTGCARPFSIAVPDDEGIFVKAGVGLGMRRLSIIDLAGGLSAGIQRRQNHLDCFSTAKSTIFQSCAPILKNVATAFIPHDTEVLFTCTRIWVRIA